MRPLDLKVGSSFIFKRADGITDWYCVVTDVDFCSSPFHLVITFDILSEDLFSSSWSFYVFFNNNNYRFLIPI